MTVDLELSVDSQSIGSFSHLRAKEVHDVQHSILGFQISKLRASFFISINQSLFLRPVSLVFGSGGFSQLLLELTVLEETFSYRNPCSFLFPLANQLYFDLK